MVDEHLQAGRELRGLAGPVAHHGGRGHHQGGALAGGATQVGEHGGRLAEAHVERQAAAELGGVEEARARPARRPGRPGARPRSPRGWWWARRARRGLGQQVGGPAGALDRRPPARGVPSRPTEWRRISAPVRRVLLARSARAAAASLRSTLSSSTHLPCDRTSGRASSARRAMSLGGELDVVEDHRPAHVAELLGADHGVAGGLGEQAQAGAGLAAREGRAPAPRSRRPRARRR